MAMKKMQFNLEKHPFHLVDPSPWPLLTALSMLNLALNATLFLHFFTDSFFFLCLAFFMLCFFLYSWFMDIMVESTFEGNHTKKVKQGIKMGMSLFIISEAMFFFSFFWAFFHFSLAPNMFMGCIWPPEKPMLRFGINFFTLKTNQNPNFTDLSTLALIVSGFSLTFGHIELMSGCSLKSLYGIFTTVMIGLLFTCMQYVEYTNSTFSINDSVFGSIFFMLTGFHGLHVIMGTLFLFICFISHCFYHFTVQTHVGLDCASWYWHFVDVVWILVYLCLYYHSYLGAMNIL